MTTWVLLLHSVGLDGTHSGRSRLTANTYVPLCLSPSCLSSTQSLPETLDRQLHGSAPPPAESRSFEPWVCLPGLQGAPGQGATPPGPRHEHRVHSEAPVHLGAHETARVSLFAFTLCPRELPRASRP